MDVPIEFVFAGLVGALFRSLARMTWPEDLFAVNLE